MKRGSIQTTQDHYPDRADHIWLRVRADRYKCCLCGGVTYREPPPYPTPASWSPETYEPLTDQERMLVMERVRPLD